MRQGVKGSDLGCGPYLEPRTKITEARRLIAMVFKLFPYHSLQPWSALPRRRSGLMVLLLIAVGSLAMAQEPLGVSMETIKTATATLASDEFEGRRVYKPGAQKTRAWLEQWLADQKLSPAGPDGRFQQPSQAGINLVAILYPKGVKKGNPTVMLSAHYDHLGRNCNSHSAARSRYCNGATDNAAGVAAVLGAVEALAGRVHTPVAVMLWDHEEGGLRGSQHFARNPSYQTEELKLIINLDIIGLNLFRGLENLHLAIGVETGGEPLVKALAAANQLVGLDLVNLSYAFGHWRSDTTSFVVSGYPVPFVFFSDGDGHVYHTTADEVAHVNFEKVAKVALLTANLAMATANNPVSYDYHRPVVRGNVALPVYEDAAALKHILTGIQQFAEQNRLSSKQTKRVARSLSQLNSIIATGPAIEQADRVFLGRVVQEIRALSKSLDFVP